MKRTNNDGVITAWKAGKPARNGRRSLTTNGRDLYSYSLKIGMRTEGGTTVVVDYTAGTQNFRSQTTSCHVGIACRTANLVMHPLVWVSSPMSEEEIPF